MKVQDEYKRIMKKMIEHAKENKIQDSDQLIQALIKELKHGALNRDNASCKPLKY